MRIQSHISISLHALVALIAINGAMIGNPQFLQATETNTLFDSEAIRDDLASLTSIVDMRHTSEVESYLRTYLERNRSKTERVVNRMMLYFPLIEQKLKEHNLPDELKYLAIVESALDPHARSRSGAMGLWQLMAPTAGDLGIRMYHSVDERKDPFRSTDAALNYLAQLYDRFGDWELALAAYNAGPNRVSRIMTKTDKSDYWSLRSDLPRETSNYIPAFIAASYVFSDYVKHGFVAERSHPDFHFTSKVEIFNHKVYLKDVAKLMKIDVDTLKFINPMYKRDYIPKSPHGYNLILPNRCLRYFHQLRDTLERSDFVKLSQLEELQNFQSFYPDSLQNIYLNTQYIVQNKENLFSVARIFDLDILQLKYWNTLPGLHVDHGMIIDLPIPLVDGRFLISDYKKIRKIYPVNSIELAAVEASHQVRGEVAYANSVCEQAQNIFQLQRDKIETPIVIKKGIAIKDQVSPENLKGILMLHQSFQIGSQLQTR